MLVKPQFEAGKHLVEPGGVVTSAEVHRQVLDSVVSNYMKEGYTFHGVVVSPVDGRKKHNREFLLHFKKVVP